MFTPSIFEDRCATFDDRCVDFRRSMCRLSKIDDRCVDLRRSAIDVSTFEDRCVDLRRSMCRCEIMLLYLLKTLILAIVVCELRRGFALQCFHLKQSDIFYVTVSNVPVPAKRTTIKNVYARKMKSTKVQTLGGI